MNLTFSLYANFFAVVVDIGLSVFVMCFLISFYPRSFLSLPKRQYKFGG